MKKSKKKLPDLFKQLKYVGYCWSQTPPGENTSMEEFVNYAKFFLCRETKTLWKDAVWADYTAEDILVEYFAHLFSKNEGARKTFEASLDAGPEVYGEDVFEWLDRKVAENQKEMETKSSQLPDRIAFSPDAGQDFEGKVDG
jgi:hypothetical protein